MEEKDATEQIIEIVKMVTDLGWSILVSGKDEEPVTGLIIGTDEYIDNILKYLPDVTS